MPEIPPDIASSVAPAGLQARQVSKDREARRADQAHASERQVKSVDEAGSTVETTDQDMAVFSDAEGTGSQGREDDSPDANSSDQRRDTADGITRGDDGRWHIDLEA